MEVEADSTTHKQNRFRSFDLGEAAMRGQAHLRAHSYSYLLTSAAITGAVTGHNQDAKIDEHNLRWMDPRERARRPELTGKCSSLE